MFRAVLLPPGKHAVRFLYRPESFRRGATISGLTISCLLVVGFVYRRKNESKQRRAADALPHNPY